MADQQYLDLHNHPFEAMGVRTVEDITAAHVERILRACRAAGVDVLAVTEHGGWSWGRAAAKLAATLADDVVVLAGQENWFYPVEVVEVELPSGRYFRFLAHPGAPAPHEPVWTRLLPGIHGIEVRNKNHQWHMNEARLRELADAHDLVPIHSSDAHDMKEVGERGFHGSLDQLERRAASKESLFDLQAALS